MSENTPKGFVGLFLDPQGCVQCEASCFDNGGGGIFDSDRNRKAHYCQQRLYRAFAAHWLYPFKDCVSLFDIEKIMNSGRRIGWKTELIPIGYEDEDNGEN